MRRRSFQVYIALWAGAVSGVVLILFVAATWYVMHEQFLQSVDLRLADPIERLGRQANQDIRWNRYYGTHEQSAEYASALPARIIAVQSHKGEPLFRSKLLFRLPTDVFREHLPSTAEIEFLSRSANGEGAAAVDLPVKLAEQLPSIRTTLPLRSFTVDDDQGVAWRVVAISGLESTIFGGAPLSEFDQELIQVRQYMLSFIVLALILIVFSGWFLSKRALHPLVRINEMASTISVEDLDQRIAVTDRDFTEFSQLVGVLNGMMERLEQSFHQATRFTADASHELKTPIAIMQAEINAALKSCALDTEEHAVLSNLSEELMRLKRILQGLLLLSQADAGHMQLTLETVDLSAECDALGEDLNVLCESNGLTAVCEITRGVTAKVDKILFMQAVQNLLSNAIKYSLEPGRVVFQLFEDEGDVCIRFMNTGHMIPPEDRENIFKRFYRMDTARNRMTDGFGLGLNLAREIVRAHDGDLRLCEYNETGLTTFEIRI